MEDCEHTLAESAKNKVSPSTPLVSGSITDHEIEFQFTFGEWLEWKRKNQSPVSLWFLRLAEALWLPLSFLLALSVVAVSLRVLKVNTSLVNMIPDWLPLVILVLLASARIYLSLFSKIRRGVLKKDWRSEVAGMKCKVELTENGFDYEAGSSIYKPTWPEVASVFQTKRLLSSAMTATVVLLPRGLFSQGKLEDVWSCYRKHSGKECNPSEAPRTQALSEHFSGVRQPFV